MLPVSRAASGNPALFLAGPGVIARRGRVIYIYINISVYKRRVAEALGKKSTFPLGRCRNAWGGRGILRESCIMLRSGAGSVGRKVIAAAGTRATRPSDRRASRPGEKEASDEQVAAKMGTDAPS